MADFATEALLFALNVDGVHFEHRYFEDGFDRRFHVALVRRCRDLEHHFVLLCSSGGFLGHDRALDHIVQARFTHDAFRTSGFSFRRLLFFQQTHFSLASSA